MFAMRWEKAAGWLAVILAATAACAAPAASPVISSDIDRFWQSYDQVRAEQEPSRQRELLQKTFLDPGTEGLKAFMQAKGYDAGCYVDAIRNYPKFWASMRAKTFALKRRGAEFEPAIAKFRELYPPLRPAKIYFTVGCLRSSGTTLDDKVLIGAELAAGDETVDLSELPDKLRRRLGVYFHGRPADQLVLLNVHEYVHTQEHGPGTSLLAQVMYEGAADFVAERVTGRTPPLPYMQYGREHEAELRRDFLAEKDNPSWSGWLYNAPDNRYGVGDLGYYVGYTIMRDYHARAADKTQALREIIELDYRDAAAVRRFATAAGIP